MTDLEHELLAACKIALRQLNYDGDDKTAFIGAAYEALTKAIARAEAQGLKDTQPFHGFASAARLDPAG